ncbi:hypothetical protein [Zobellia russellii]|uniref:hypothetical protein n=2 Tax=Zobellia russellii TaxID=248907 RepID=UPI0037DDA9A3
MPAGLGTHVHQRRGKALGYGPPLPGFHAVALHVLEMALAVEYLIGDGIFVVLQYLLGNDGKGAGKPLVHIALGGVLLAELELHLGDEPYLLGTGKGQQKKTKKGYRDLYVVLHFSSMGTNDFF